MSHLILVRGLPGSGKTSFTDLINYFTKRIVAISADDYFYDSDGNYNFDASKLWRAHRSCESRTRQALQQGFAVMVHNTFTKTSEINPYKKIAEEEQCSFTSLIVENRHGNESIHGVPDETMEKMKKRFVVEL